ncbi:MAG: TetR/AcrR family transcriptional regulator [Rhodospirillales bacterium]|nr:TetR/AcrR family transcriptional regulator [Rhodospirillales bacterium]
MAIGAIQINSADSAPMTPKQASIVEAAAKLFLERGFGAVSMDAIAAEAVVSKRTVYSYYQNKETLFGDVMCLCCEENGGQEGCPLMSEDLITNVLPSEMLQKSGEHVLKIITNPQVLEMFRVVMSEAGRFPDLGKTFYEFGPGWIINQMADYLDGLVAAGKIEIGDTQAAARKFFGMVTFPIQMELMLGIEQAVSEERIAEISRSAVKTFAAAYGLK